MHLPFSGCKQTVNQAMQVKHAAMKVRPKFPQIVVLRKGFVLVDSDCGDIVLPNFICPAGHVRDSNLFKLKRQDMFANYH